uniref:cyclic nucleotide-binding domain-containing protein n=1 Tax=Burkholderia guangdongensis TaxID=1792500 RepID=UPI0015C9D3AC
MNQQQATRSRPASPGETIYSEGYAGERAIYVIAEGKVEIFTRCEDKKVTLATLGKGGFFGEASLLAGEAHTHSAKALTFCQLTIVPADVVEQELERASPLLRHLVRTIIRRAQKTDDLLATYTHADFLPGVVSYAHVLALMAAKEGGGARDVWGARRGQSGEVSVPLPDVVKKCRAIAGHSRSHVMTMLKRMEKLNLLAVETGTGERVPGGDARTAGATGGAVDRQVVTFEPARIADRAQRVADEELDLAISSDLELIDLDDLEALIGVDKSMILNKLSRAEIAEDLFAFRKTRVLSVVEEKGVAYFSRLNPRARVTFGSLEDIEFVDDRTLFEAISRIDTYALAKLLASISDRTIADRLTGAMSEGRKNEIAWVMRRDLKVDPIEVAEIEQTFLDTIKAIKAAASGAAEPAERGA